MTKNKKQEKTTDIKITKEERLIYCGPNIGYKAIKDTVYIGGIPKMLDRELKDCKEIENLFVPIEKYSETRQRIKEEGTIESISYKVVQELLKNKRGEK